MQQSLPDYLLLLAYTLGLKQLLFDYKKTQWLRDRIATIPLLNELNHCVYCQTIEVSFVVYVILGKFSIDSVLAILANGFIAIAIDNSIRNAIMEAENARNFKPTYFKNPEVTSDENEWKAKEKADGETVGKNTES